MELFAYEDLYTKIICDIEKIIKGRRGGFASLDMFKDKVYVCYEVKVFVDKYNYSCINKGEATESTHIFGIPITSKTNEATIVFDKSLTDVKAEIIVDKIKNMNEAEMKELALLILNKTQK